MNSGIITLWFSCGLNNAVDSRNASEIYENFNWTSWFSYFVAYYVAHINFNDFLHDKLKLLWQILKLGDEIEVLSYISTAS